MRKTGGVNQQLLVGVDELARLIESKAVVVVDCRFNLLDTSAGEHHYQQGHIASAHYAHLDRDLSGPVTADSGRHPLPDPETLAATFGRWGINEQTAVVAYDDAGGVIASRLWWLLRWLGNPHGRVLDGGLQAWITAAMPLTAIIPQATANTFPAQPDDSQWLTVAVLQQRLQQRDLRLIDARSASRFRGEQEPIDPVAGHVPGAENIPLEGNLVTGTGTFLSPNDLSRRFTAPAGSMTSRDVVHMCGSGVSACHNILAMEIAGLGGSKLYPGSWSEWIRDPARKVAGGA